MPCFTSPSRARAVAERMIRTSRSSYPWRARWHTQWQRSQPKADHYAFGKRNTRPLQMLLGRELCARGAGPCRSGLAGATRHGLSLDAGLRKHAEKLEQDGGGRHAGDAAGVKGRRDLDEIGADEIEAPEISDQALGFKCREAAGLRRPRSWRIDRIERVNIEGEIGGAATDDLSRFLGRWHPVQAIFPMVLQGHLGNGVRTFAVL